MIAFTIPRMRLVNTSNVREHWSKRAKRTADQRQAAKLYTLKAIFDLAIAPPYDVTIVRIGPGRMDRSNIYVAAKAVEDGVCDALGCNDGDDLAWSLTCRQEPPQKGTKGPDRYAVRVEIRLRGERAA
jgi:hypothetical protein